MRTKFTEGASVFFALLLSLPAQGSSDSSMSEEPADLGHKVVTSSISDGNPAKGDDEAWKAKAHDLSLWSLQQKLRKQGKKLGQPITNADFAT